MPIRPWIVLDSNRILSNQWLTVRVDKCRIPSLNKVVDDFYIIERKDSVHVVPITNDHKVILVRQYRHGCQQIIYELPAGYTNQGETPLQAAERELREETGYVAGRIDLLTMLYYSPAVLTNKAYIFIGTELQVKETQILDETEDIEITLFDIEQLIQVGAGDDILVDSITVSGILLAYQHLKAKS